VEALVTAQPAPGANGAAAAAPVPLDPDRLRSAIYRQYGAYLDVRASGVVEDRGRGLDVLAKEVASSVVQQRERILDLSEDVLTMTLGEHCPPNVHPEEWDFEALGNAVKERFGFAPSLPERLLDREALAEKLWAEIETIIEARETEFSLPMFLYLSRVFLLEEIDQRWIEHLKAMEALREGIGLRGYGQKDPKQEYKKEGFEVFGMMMVAIQKNVSEKLFHVQVRSEEPAAAVPAAPRRAARRTIESGGGTQAADAGEASQQRRNEPKVGRNDPCPCGSGKKYKKCHGAADASVAG
jgi:preprotein translocase subunit SecA